MYELKLNTFYQFDFSLIKESVFYIFFYFEKIQDIQTFIQSFIQLCQIQIIQVLFHSVMTKFTKTRSRQFT